jgi:hypothetical protein
VSPGSLPLVGCRGEGLQSNEFRSMSVDPARQPVPLAEERFVGDFDGRLVGRRITVERQQPPLAEGVKNPREDNGIEIEARQLGERQAPPRLGRAAAELHESEEELHRDLPGIGRERVVDRLGAPRQNAPDPAQRAVAIERERRRAALVEQLGEGVLEQWQRPRPMRGVAYQLGEQGGLDDDPGLFGGPDDRRLELFRGHR